MWWAQCSLPAVKGWKKFYSPSKNIRVKKVFMSRHSQHIVVIGGASGLGRELVLEASHKGHRIAFLDINDIRAKQLGQTLADNNVEYIYQHCDIREEEACRRALERIAHRWGHIDMVIQAAGVAS